MLKVWRKGKKTNEQEQLPNNEESIRCWFILCALINKANRLDPMVHLIRLDDSRIIYTWVICRDVSWAYAVEKNTRTNFLLFNAIFPVFFFTYWISTSHFLYHLCRFTCLQSACRSDLILWWVFVKWISLCKRPNYVNPLYGKQSVFVFYFFSFVCLILFLIQSNRIRETKNEAMN